MIGVKRMFIRVKLSRRFCILGILSSLLVLYIFCIRTWKTYPSSAVKSEDERVQTNQSIRQLFDLDLLTKITSLNLKSALLNAAQYSSLENNNLVVVVQVHTRVNYLKHLIDSLSKVKGIESVLIVFSHDFYDSEINSLVQSIIFCKVVQIYFPFSQQIWMNTFPATSITDCQRDLSKQEAKRIRCQNADFPDTYGHYRSSDVTQTKHHWFWKLNYVFEHLSHTNHHNGDFIFVEEDHYFSPDFLHIWKLMKRIEPQKSSNNIDIITMGHYKNINNFQENSNKVRLSQWYSSKHNMGFSVSRNLWQEIKSCSYQFCTFDDYNWDWSLMHIFSKCLKRRINTLVPEVPRLYHIGTCGLHHKGSNCDVNKKVSSIESQFARYNRWLFPSNLISIAGERILKTNFKKNGGWSDPRDQQLCMQYNSSFKQIVGINLNFEKFFETQKLF